MKILIQKNNLKYFFLTVSHFINIVSDYFISWYIINLIGVSQFGNFSIQLTFVSIVLGLAGVLYGYDIQRKLSTNITTEEKSEIFLKQFLLQLIIIFIIFLIGPFIGLYVIEDETNNIFYILLLYMVFNFIYSQATLFQRYSLYLNQYSITIIMHSMINITILIIITLNNIKDYKYIIIAQAIMFLMSSIFAYQIGVKGNLKFVKIKLTISDFWSDLTGALPLISVFLVQLIMFNGDRYIIIHILGAYSLGIYIYLLKISAFVMISSKLINIILIPTLSKKMSKSLKSGYESFINISRIYFLLSVAILIPLILFYEIICKIIAPSFDLTIYFKLSVILLFTSFINGSYILLSSMSFSARQNHLSSINLTIFILLLNFIGSILSLYLTSEIIFVAISTLLGMLILSYQSLLKQPKIIRIHYIKYHIYIFGFSFILLNIKNLLY